MYPSSDDPQPVIDRVTQHAALILLRANRPTWNLEARPRFGLSEDSPPGPRMSKREQAAAFCRQAEHKHRHLEVPTITAATDGGAAMDGCAGSGIFLRWNDAQGQPTRYFRGFQGLGQASNNVAELYAMAMLQRYLMRHQPPLHQDTPILILCDSQYTIKLLTSRSAPKKNQRLVHAVRAGHEKLGRRYPLLQLIYSPSHAGIFPNEEADKLATRGVEDSQDGNGYTATELNHHIDTNTFLLTPANCTNIYTCHHFYPP